MSYEAEIAQTQKDIAEAGQLVIWRKPQTVSDEAQPWKSAAGDPEDHDVSIVFLSQGDGLATALFRLLPQTDVPTGGPKGLLAGGLDFTPEITDVVVRGSEILNIASIDPLAPDGTPILYKIRFA